MGAYDALIEIWNGVPFMTPLWCRKPRIGFLHHVHGPMWGQILPPPLASLGQLLEKRLAVRRITISVTDSARAWLAETGYDPAYGARPLRRLIQSAIGDPLARKLIGGEVADGGAVTVDVGDDGLVLR
jgi:hypothetical protein